MKITEAVALLCTPIIDWRQPQSWCDLGAGNGTFTMALAQLLAPDSTIYAVDLESSSLEEIPNSYGQVKIHKIVGDLQSPSLRLPTVDGFLMANSLHFIQDQQLLLRKLSSLAESFLIVEYERTRPNPWGPYPVGFEKLREFLAEAGLKYIEKLATRRSMFGGTMYSVLAQHSGARS